MTVAGAGKRTITLKAVAHRWAVLLTCGVDSALRMRADFGLEFGGKREIGTNRPEHNIKKVLKEVVRVWAEFRCAGTGSETGFSEHGTGFCSSIKGVGCPKQLSDCHILKKVFGPWGSLIRRR
jgi:hypothetical protein